jgi:hypothetical protein
MTQMFVGTLRENLDLDFKSNNTVINIITQIITYGGGIDAADNSPTSLIVHLWIYTAHYCPSSRTEHKGGRALNATYLLMIRDWPSLVKSSNCR